MNKRNTTIKQWWNLISSSTSKEEAEKDFVSLYRNNKPTLGELILTGDCPNNCAHCIYSTDYGRENLSVSLEKWKDIVENLYFQLDIRTFIFCGRSIKQDTIDLLAHMRSTYSDVSIGIIDDGISIRPFLEPLAEIKLDWIDISVDGLEAEHDRQRGTGRFDKTFNTLLYINKYKITEKLNILTTVTSINKESITEMLVFLHNHGLKNFFITHVVDFEPWKSLKNLKVTETDWYHLYTRLKDTMDQCEDIYLELAMFDSELFASLEEREDVCLGDYSFFDESIYYDLSQNNNTFYLSYEPESLAGIRDCVVSPEGNIINNRAMTTGALRPEYCFGNVQGENLNELYDTLSSRQVFEHYLNEFLKEFTCFQRRIK